MTHVLLSLFVGLQIALPLQFPKDKLLEVPGSEKIIAKINGKDLRASEVNQMLWDWFGNQTMQIMIGSTMVEDAAKKVGVTVAHEEVIAAVETQVAGFRSSLPEGRSFEDHLRLHGLSYTKIYLQTRTDLLAKKIALKDFKPEEVRQLSHILILFKGSTEKDKEDARIKAMQAYNTFMGGETWDNVVTTYSEDISTKQNAGRLGYVAMIELPENARDTVLNLDNWQITQPIEADFGYVIFRMDKKNPPTGNEIEAAKTAFLSRRMRIIYNEINDNSKVETFLLPTVKDEEK